MFLSMLLQSKAFVATEQTVILNSHFQETSLIYERCSKSKLWEKKKTQL